jgi:hypothetical protein
MMRIWIDADACPVKEIVLRLAKEYHLPVTLVCDTSHQLSYPNATVVTVDRHGDSADLAIINQAEKGDLLVTQDYGLAALALGKGLFAIHQSGMEFTNDNMDELLFTRALSAKQRRAGRKTGGPKKRTREDDRNFEGKLAALLARLTGENAESD